MSEDKKTEYRGDSAPIVNTSKSLDKTKEETEKKKPEEKKK